MKISFKYPLFLILSLFLSLSSLMASKSYTWNGSQDSDWNTPRNWDNAPGSNGAGVYLVEGPSTYTNAPVISNSPSFVIEDLGISGGTELSMNGGTLTLPGDFAIAEGSTFILSGGSLTVEGDFYLGDAGSAITINGGDLIIGGDINLGATDGVNNSTGSSGSTSFIINNGNVIATNLVYSSETGDSHSFSLTGGALQLSGDIRSDGEDVNLNISGSSIVIVGDDIIMDGGNDSFTMSNGILTVAGDWENQGNTAISGGTIRMNGLLTQRITNPAGQEFFNLTIDNSLGGILLQDSIIINNQLRFIEGVIDGNGNSVTFIDNSSTSGASIFGFVEGAVNKIGNNAFTFPIGADFAYRPISISAPNTVIDVYRAQYFKSNPNALYPLNQREVGLATISQLEYWTLDRLVGSSAETVTLSFDENSLVEEIADLRVCRWDAASSEWKNEGIGTTKGTASNGTIGSAANISNFSPFTLGSVSPSNPLPVNMLDMKLSRKENSVSIDWKTAQEWNNSHFVIERTFDGEHIEEIGEVESKAKGGNSNIELQYSYQDAAQNTSKVYYRIKQIDINGEYTVYPFMMLDQERLQQSGITEVSIYPNPSSDSRITLSFKKDFELQVEIYSEKGQLIESELTKVSDGHYYIEGINLNPGMYIIRCINASNGELVANKKIIRQ